MKKHNLEEPLNQNERYLYAIAIRMDAMCNMISSFMEAYATVNDITTTANEEKLVKSEETNTSASEEVEIKPKKSRKK